MKFVKFMQKGGFLITLLAVFLAADALLQASGFVRDSGLFWRDDFEITQAAHPEPVWEGVVYGSSELTSGYREDLSSTGYVNLGMDYATIEELYTLLDKGYITVDRELILALNWGVLWDELDTNPTYIWHKGALEPYVYFERGRLSKLIEDDFRALLGDGEYRAASFLNQHKEYYHGNMTDEELAARVTRLNDLFFYRGAEGYDGNIAALGRVFDWCAAHDLEVRALWLPENPKVSLGPVNDDLLAAAAQTCAEHGVDFANMKNALDADCFYDTGHMDYEHGAAEFTEVLDAWINSKKS